ncbi:hypothetical protein K0M31_011422 [Melipona bicolor]|uniref:Uncharacterized protein n=1 Tax=Melipona bicolor TaxID=60889 RepID=A0AA40G9Q5_9HYME|nr:hypothetical protein K0M31_011422 [Melipona bicolor]
MKFHTDKEPAPVAAARRRRPLGHYGTTTAIWPDISAGKTLFYVIAEAGKFRERGPTNDPLLRDFILPLIVGTGLSLRVRATRDSMEKQKRETRSRKRRPSSSNDSERSYSGWSDRILHGCGREGCRTNERGDCMDECTAALVLMSLSCSPHSPQNPLPVHCQHNYGSWGGRGGGVGGVVVGSPGVGGTSNSSSSSGASWRSGTPSPPLSDEGAPTTGSLWPTSAHPSHNQQHYPYNASGSSSSSTPGSTTTLDEGIVPDYLEEQHPRKKKVSGSL